MVGTFLEIMGGLKVPVGSIIVISSMTHLLVEGLDAYTVAVVEQAARLVRAFRGGVIAVPGVPVMLAGSRCPVAVRVLYDFCQWLPAITVPDHGGVGFMGSAARAVADTLLAEVGDEQQASYGAAHLLPRDMNGFKQRWYCSGGTSLKNGVAPLSPDKLKKIQLAIKLDLNVSFNLNLDPESSSPVAKPTEDAYNKWRFVLVGASHAARLCDVMVGLNMVATTMGTASWFPNKRNCEKLEQDLKEFLAGLEPDPDRTTVVVFSPLDKSYFQARSEDGSYSPHRCLDGVYHVDGDLVACPLEHLKFQFELLVPVFKTTGSAVKLLLGPIPRYIHSGCCSDPEHAPNRADEDFQEKIMDGLEKAKRTMRSLAFKHGLKDMKIINPGRILESGEFWGVDPVHPTVDGYRKLLDTIITNLVAATGDKFRETEQQQLKRPQSEQLVGPVRRPYWVTAGGATLEGQELASCSNGPRRGGRGGGGGRGGRWFRRGHKMV
jgi:hypothetical protein